MIINFMQNVGTVEVNPKFSYEIEQILDIEYPALQTFRSSTFAWHLPTFDILTDLFIQMDVGDYVTSEKFILLGPDGEETTWEFVLFPLGESFEKIECENYHTIVYLRNVYETMTFTYGIGVLDENFGTMLENHYIPPYAPRFLGHGGVGTFVGFVASILDKHCDYRIDLMFAGKIWVRRPPRIVDSGSSTAVIRR